MVSGHNTGMPATAGCLANYTCLSGSVAVLDVRVIDVASVGERVKKKSRNADPGVRVQVDCACCSSKGTPLAQLRSIMSCMTQGGRIYCSKTGTTCHQVRLWSASAAHS